ncbi:MAG: 50S ribosomal protein L18a [Candidatus Woesearchaeota archaeon]|nr:MAG: 50S ribosomal protein L18a [Candidatus Woesearchaeota archaeon]
MKTFEFKGTFKKGFDPSFPFTKTIEADSEEEAKMILYALMGASHKCPRRFIKIDDE